MVTEMRYLDAYRRSGLNKVGAFGDRHFLTVDGQCHGICFLGRFVHSFSSSVFQSTRSKLRR